MVLLLRENGVKNENDRNRGAQVVERQFEISRAGRWKYFAGQVQMEVDD
jgi:phage replication-related protein YjqB (UPF0714/DUF867 family)